MKNFFFSFGLCFLLSPAVIFAQFNKDPILNIQNEDLKPINFGYYLGFNQYDFQFEYQNDIGQDVLVDTSFGFNVGVLAELRINDFLDIRFEPGLL
ncbi:MAG: outer membrane beta-barrel protein, partial [Bacteroidota bacterium]